MAKGRSPIEIMIDASDLRCAVCGAKAGTCDCWVKCNCGWSYRRGETCGNPAHEIARGVATEALAYIDLMYPAMWTGVAKLARKSIRNMLIREVETAIDQSTVRHIQTGATWRRSR